MKNQDGFFFPLSIIISFVILSCMLELTYIYKTRTEATADFINRTRLNYAAQSGAEIFKAWYDKDSTLNNDVDFNQNVYYTSLKNVESKTVFTFTDEDISVEVKALLNRFEIPRWLVSNTNADDTLITSENVLSPLPCVFFASVATIKNQRRTYLIDSVSTYGSYVFSSKGRRWIQFYK